MKVFLSSTYIDLKELRRCVFEYFNQYELRMEGMEIWSSAPEEPIETCLSKVKACDIYIGVLGFRYGSIDEVTGTSITELEYNEAENAGIDRLIFLMNDEYMTKSAFVDKGVDAEKLERFKKRVKHNHFVSFFSSEQHFSERLNATFRDYILSRGIQKLEGFNFRTIWHELEDLWRSVEVPETLRTEVALGNDIRKSLDKIDETITGLEEFHNYLMKSYANLPSDLMSVFDKLGLDKEKLEEIPHYDNPFENRDWEILTYFPNRIKKLRLNYFHIKLDYLRNRAINEPWSEHLRREILELKEEYRNEIMRTINPEETHIG